MIWLSRVPADFYQPFCATFPNMQSDRPCNQVPFFFVIVSALAEARASVPSRFRNPMVMDNPRTMFGPCPANISRTRWSANDFSNFIHLTSYYWRSRTRPAGTSRPPLTMIHSESNTQRSANRSLIYAGRWRSAPYLSTSDADFLESNMSSGGGDLSIPVDIAIMRRKLQLAVLQLALRNGQRSLQTPRVGKRSRDGRDSRVRAHRELL